MIAAASVPPHTAASVPPHMLRTAVTLAAEACEPPTREERAEVILRTVVRHDEHGRAEDSRRGRWHAPQPKSGGAQSERGEAHDWVDEKMGE